jgi:hypothetical protein
MGQGADRRDAAQDRVGVDPRSTSSSSPLTQGSYVRPSRRYCTRAVQVPARLSTRRQSSTVPG